MSNSGNFIKRFFTGKLNTNDPFSIVIMILAGLLLLFPLVGSLAEMSSTGNPLMLWCTGPLALLGVFMLWNVFYSLKPALGRLLQRFKR